MAFFVFQWHFAGLFPIMIDGIPHELEKKNRLQNPAVKCINGEMELLYFR